MKLNQLSKNFQNKLSTTISVIGLGYVGLPLAISAAQSGYEVYGIDVDQVKVDLIKSGKSPVEDISDPEIQNAVSGKLKLGSDFSPIKESSIVIICVPTPLDVDRKPDLSLIDAAVKSFAKHLTKSTLVILESTVQPGTTRDYLVSLILKYSALTPSDFNVAYSPERIDPANKKWNLKNTPKIVAGLNPTATKQTRDFYSKFVDNIVECESPEVAELAKLLENTFRYVNISFINELSMFCRSFGVDVNQVIAAASTKPYGFMPFYPSIGVGGHCIPVDPLYLLDKARTLGVQTKFIDLADEINTQMPNYFLKVAKEKIGGLRGKKVLVIGVSYKPNVADVRETPVEALIFGLRKEGAQVFWHDDLVKEWNDEKSSPLDQGYNLAILATAHDYLNLKQIGNTPLINTRESI
jgi:UDP-N-acetyl-D-glucosamine dehydrogenase